MTVSENTYKLAQLIQEDKRRQAADLLATAPVDVRMMLNKHADTLLSLACAQHNFPLADGKRSTRDGGVVSIDSTRFAGPPVYGPAPRRYTRFRSPCFTPTTKQPLMHAHGG